MGVGQDDSVMSTERPKKRKASSVSSDVRKKKQKDKSVRFTEHDEDSTIIVDQEDGSIRVTGNPSVTVTDMLSTEEVESGTSMAVKSGTAGGSDLENDDDSSDGQSDERSGRDLDWSSSGPPAASRAPTAGGSSGGASGAAGAPSNPAPPSAAAVVAGIPDGTVLMNWPLARSAVVAWHKKKLQVAEYDGQHGSVVTWLQQVDNAVEMTAVVNSEEWDNAELYHAVANKLIGRAAIWFVNISRSMTTTQKTYGYLKNILCVEYGEDLEPDQVIARLNKRGMKSHETLNEYAAALREIGQGCKDMEEKWYVNAFQRGVPTYVRGHVITAAPWTLDTVKQFAIKIGGKYGLENDIVPDEKPKYRRDEDKVKQEPMETSGAPVALPSGTKPGDGFGVQP